MKYISVAETAKRWGVSERSVRGYCAEGKIDGAFLTGKTWNIPETAEKPDRMNKKTDTPKTLLEVLKAEKAAKLHGGIYHKIQIDLTYNSNHMEGSRLTHDQTRYIFETNTIGASDGTVKVDDVVETANHFKCIDMVIDNANYAPSEAFIKQLHAVLKNGTSDSRLDWFAVGNYKKLPNEVGGMDTTAPENVGAEMKKLLCRVQRYPTAQKPLTICSTFTTALSASIRSRTATAESGACSFSKNACGATSCRLSSRTTSRCSTTVA